ncbi:hypothetical protein Y032_0105g3699 [Ancylostoma ceylanicum]|uniref:Uncharacterized protein n=1 Tax=Ancylostoma ceylanicum TaxID=53326 RepID=A0A016TGA1_9BILA|nr:hypothetical protein Y032_0105g3699 [Ancylostoma ceylanicum]
MKSSMIRTSGCRETVKRATELRLRCRRLAPILHHIDARASVARIRFKLPLSREKIELKIMTYNKKLVCVVWCGVVWCGVILITRKD